MSESLSEQPNIYDALLDEEITEADAKTVLSTTSDQELLEAVINYRHMFCLDDQAADMLGTTVAETCKNSLNPQDPKLLFLVRDFVQSYLTLSYVDEIVILCKEELVKYLIEVGYFRKPGAETLKRNLGIVESFVRIKPHNKCAQSRLSSLRNEFKQKLKLN